MAVLKALRGLGISESLLEQVRPVWFLSGQMLATHRRRRLRKTRLNCIRFAFVLGGRSNLLRMIFQESLNRASEKLLHMRHEHDQLLAQYREMESRLSPSSLKPPSVAGDGAPVVEEVGSVPMDDEFEAPPLVTGQAVDVSSDWPGPPSVDVFVENSDSTKRARVTLPSGSLLVEAVESGQFDEGDAKRMMAVAVHAGFAGDFAPRAVLSSLVGTPTMLGIMAGMARKTASRFFLAVTCARLVLPVTMHLALCLLG